MSGRRVAGPPAALARAAAWRRGCARARRRRSAARGQSSPYGGGEAEAAGSWVPPDLRARALTHCARRAADVDDGPPVQLGLLYEGRAAGAHAGAGKAVAALPVALPSPPLAHAEMIGDLSTCDDGGSDVFLRVSRRGDRRDSRASKAWRRPGWY